MTRTNRFYLAWKWWKKVETNNGNG